MSLQEKIDFVVNNLKKQLNNNLDIENPPKHILLGTHKINNKNNNKINNKVFNNMKELMKTFSDKFNSDTIFEIVTINTYTRSIYYHPGFKIKLYGFSSFRSNKSCSPFQSNTVYIGYGIKTKWEKESFNVYNIYMVNSENPKIIKNKNKIKTVLKDAPIETAYER